MDKIPAWMDGAVFGLLFVPLAFFLKIICPLSTGCFVDPFFVPIFSPLLLLEIGIDKIGLSFSVREEIVFLIIFWTVLWALLAHFGSKVFRQVHGDEVGEEEE